MGKIKVKGTATMEFEPDYYKFNVTVNLNRSSSGEAIAQGHRRVEEILGLLHDKMNIDLSTVTLDDESVTIPYNEVYYKYKKSFYFCYEADNSVTESIVNLLNRLDNVEYDLDFKLNDIAEKYKLVMSAALDNARERAEKLAEAFGSHVSGFEEIRYDFIDEENEDVAVAGGSHYLREERENCSQSLASKIRSHMIEITESVDVICLTDK